MKNVIVLALVFVVYSGVIITAQQEHQHQNKKDATVVTTKGDTTSASHNVSPKITASMKEIIEHYLHLKNALVNDNSKDAAASGKELVAALGKLDKNSLSPEQRKFYEDVEEDAKENAEHISENAGKIDHQREHFDMLTTDVYDLVKEFGGGQVLYKLFCPMYNDKKGAYWLSESKTIKNPYYGKKMLTCGSVKEEIK
ncbi:DUF3347 domain-containing protein [Ignavibacterium sp.]|uniref:DUF3347 domain-containing protein n=1 Tax=Ignavibacterium sp. TaxID=2651167 RepID=UPI0021F9D406|nr:DUF3347 domain-containing protein [Ignavibacterium sp.]BDQ04332.1 MAG: hypothetical protein KatS3mg037_2907 [Ignavibacterium sp.]